MSVDPSNGYDAIANDYVEARSSVGVELIENWASHLPEGASILDLGCGHGLPITPALLKAKLDVWAIDASPNMVRLYQASFPNLRVSCETVESSKFFERRFDAVIAIGLLFLLPEAGQTRLIKKVAAALNPGGRLLFSAPRERGEWHDLLTDRLSTSLGEAAYSDALQRAGLTRLKQYKDEGGNNFYEAEKQDLSR